MPLSANKTTNSQFYLVSLGIGDPDNITVRALKTIEKADVIFSISRVPTIFPDLLKDKEVYDAGHGLFSSLARRRFSEEEVLAMEEETRQIIRKAVNAGKTVAVLEYGDPMVYGPQAGYINEFKDLNPIVIPGVSSFNAANAALGRGLTDGPNSETVILTTAKSTSDGYSGTDSLVKLSETRSTMVFFTMKLDIAEVVKQLKQNYPGHTPIAIVLYAGDNEKQSVLQATLDTIVEKTADLTLPFEHMIYVGEFLNDDGHK